MKTELITSLAQVDPAAWDALAGEDDPFCEHSFLLALERSRSVGPGTGWLPMHVVVREGERMVGAMPLYLKQHSYGEYLFDFGWADAAYRAGIRYYPKLVSMVPFTPATGRRLLYASDVDPRVVTRCLLEGALGAREETRASSIHLLFLSAEERARVCEDGRFLPRSALQFHWHNAGFADFEAHLSTFRSSVRKEVRKERRRVAQSGLEIAMVPGTELSDAQWEALADFYFDTCEKHGSGPYLTRAFFDELRRTHAHRVVAALARRDRSLVAGTLNFEKGRHLYGRYWGAFEEHDSLHFELCYHRLIERAIERGCTRFEAGAQGIHKLKRGLLPTEIGAACYVDDPRLGHAVAEYLAREAVGVQREIAELFHHGPSHREA